MQTIENIRLIGLHESIELGRTEQSVETCARTLVPSELCNFGHFIQGSFILHELLNRFLWQNYSTYDN